MKKYKSYERIYQLWISPLLIGALISIGYNFTKNIAISNYKDISSSANPRKIYSFRNKELASSKIINSIQIAINNLDAKEVIDRLLNSSETKKIKLTGQIKSSIIERKIKISNNIKPEKIMNPIPNSLPKIKSINSSSNEKEKVDFADSKFLEAESFFNKYDLENLFKTLPNE